MTPLTRAHLDGNAQVKWQLMEQVKEAPTAPGVYVHCIKDLEFVLYVGSGTGVKGLRGRLSDGARFVSKARLINDIDIRRERWAPAIAGVS